MKGCRPLSESEIGEVMDSFWGKNKLRDQALFMLGIFTGRRVSQLLSLKVSDVLTSTGEIAQNVYFERQNCKGKREGEAMPLHSKARDALRAFLKAHGDANPYLFAGRQGGAISRQQAHNVLKAAFEGAGLDGKVATHSMRKTFARRMMQANNNDIYLVKQLLNHRNIETTIRYVNIDRERMDKAILSV